jgi:Nucleotidyltransferase of unknown function (DUF6036)
MFCHKEIQDPWFSFLTELDSLTTGTVRFNCLGGFVVTMLYGLNRTTADLDFLEIVPRPAATAIEQVAMAGGELHKKYKVYLDRVTVAQPPFNYDERLREMFPGAFRNIRLMALDPYDLALTKLGRNIERDRSDVRHLAATVPFDLDLFQKRYLEELRPYIQGMPEMHDRTMQFWIDDIQEDRNRRAT